VARAGQGVGELGEQRRVLRQLPGRLPYVVLVVEAEAEHLRRIGHDRGEVGVGQGLPPALVGHPVRAGGHHGADVGRVEGHDVVTLDPTGAGAVRRPQGDQSHEASPYDATSVGTELAPPLWSLVGRRPSDVALADDRDTRTWQELESRTNA